MAAPLAPAAGGTSSHLNKLYAAISEANILMHSPPDIGPGAEIMGVCAVSEQLSGMEKYGWIARDFLVWKSLFNGVGNPAFQHWYSTLDISNFSKNNRFGVDGARPPVESTTGTSTPSISPLPADNSGFVESFLSELSKRAKDADSRKNTLLAMVFAPVTPEHDIIVDFEATAVKDLEFLTVETIRNTIRDAIKHEKLPVTLMTVSSLTGGWVCRPSLFAEATSYAPEGVLQTIASSCGGAFADTFMMSFTTSNTPLLTENQREKLPFDDLMPVKRTEQQVALLHKFQRAIRESLGVRLCINGGHHKLLCEPLSDAWAKLAARKGYPLTTFWEARMALQDKLDTDILGGFDFLGEAFGGSRASQLFHLKYLIAVEFATCPGDWTRNMTGITANMLKTFLHKLSPTVGEVRSVFDTIEYRASNIHIAQILVKALGLPIPGKMCRYWSDQVSDDICYLKMQVGFGDILNLFAKPAPPPGEVRHEYRNVRFYRPSRWMAAALAIRLADKSDNEIRAFIANEIAPLFRLLREKQQELLRNNVPLMSVGREWIRSLNLGIDVMKFAVTTEFPHVQSAPAKSLEPVAITDSREGPVQPPESSPAMESTPATNTVQNVTEPQQVVERLIPTKNGVPTAESKTEQKVDKAQTPSLATNWDDKKKEPKEEPVSDETIVKVEEEKKSLWNIPEAVQGILTHQDGDHSVTNILTSNGTVQPDPFATEGSTSGRVGGPQPTSTNALQAVIEHMSEVQLRILCTSLVVTVSKLTSTGPQSTGQAVNMTATAVPITTEDASKPQPAGTTNGGKGITPLETPVGVRPVENYPTPGDGSEDGAEHDDLWGVQSDKNCNDIETSTADVNAEDQDDKVSSVASDIKSVNGSQRCVANSVDSLVSGEDFWKRVGW